MVMLLIAGVVLAIVLISGVLALLMMHERATRTQTDNCHGHGNDNIVLGVAVEHEIAIATIMAMIGVSASNMTSSMLGAQENTIYNKYCCCYCYKQHPT